MRAAFLALSLLASCAASSPPVELGGGWPPRADAYDDAYEHWTRHADRNHDYSMAIDAYATLKSDAWRAAFVAEVARRTRMSPEAEGRLAASEQVASNQGWEVELIVATGDLDWNDFAASKGRTMWRLVLVGSDGQQVGPTSVREDKRVPAELAEWFPGGGPFHRAYIVTFPKVPAVDGRLALKIGSALASVEMTWSR